MATRKKVKAGRTIRGRRPMRVGDRVRMIEGDTRIVTVVEDRGNLGVGGRRLLSVHRFDPENGVDIIYEVPEVELERVS